MAKEPKLTEDAQRFVVQHLAMYDTPAQVVAAVKEVYDIDISRSTVRQYDPTAGKSPAKKWRALFESTRKNFIDKAGDIPIAQRAVRLRRLERMAQKLEDKGNVIGAAHLIEQAAKDSGGAYTNRRELTGKDGAPLPKGTQVWVVGGKEIHF